jgi:hypothetical protein
VELPRAKLPPSRAQCLERSGASPVVSVAQVEGKGGTSLPIGYLTQDKIATRSGGRAYYGDNDVCALLEQVTEEPEEHAQWFGASRNQSSKAASTKPSSTTTRSKYRVLDPPLTAEAARSGGAARLEFTVAGFDSEKCGMVWWTTRRPKSTPGGANESGCTACSSRLWSRVNAASIGMGVGDRISD